MRRIGVTRGNGLGDEYGINMSSPSEREPSVEGRQGEGEWGSDSPGEWGNASNSMT
jgi:hypothetical protein